MNYKRIGGAAADDQNYQINNDKESSFIQDQVQVYYVGFCDQEELCDTLNDIMVTIDYNKDIPSCIIFSCSVAYLENLPQCFNDFFLMQNLNLLQEGGTEIYYEKNPQGFLDMIKKFPNSVCMVTIYGHGSNINPSIQLSKNCIESCHQTDILSSNLINNSLQNSGNLYIFVFFSCYATNLAQGLESLNILAIVPNTCSEHDIPTLREQFPNKIIDNYENLSELLSKNSYFEIGESENQTNDQKKEYFDNKLNGLAIMYNFGHPSLIKRQSSDGEYDYGSDQGDFEAESDFEDDDEFEQDGSGKRIKNRRKLKFKRRSIKKIKKKSKKKKRKKQKKIKKTKKNKKGKSVTS